MLKIKEDINLKILETKYGFTKADCLNTYYYDLEDFKDNNKLSGSIVVNPYGNSKDTRRIVFNSSSAFGLDDDDIYDGVDDAFECDILFDLIKDGLVVKVKE